MNQSMSRSILKQQAVTQSKLFGNLKGWLKVALNISSLSLVLALFGSNIHPAIQIIGTVCLVLSAISAYLIGYALKKGRDNLNKIFTLLEKDKE
ncbi:hypothetical protein [Allobaculum stercoricanis]|uniref:hypothetical protein n=1 Tax=Allobaculum stercoricanis TaxID=174709 RepID=UPI0029426CE1|nr:hypothetical protein [Allobaculum stercoricanis]